MAWTKDLGNVKGEQGDIFVPEIINNAETGKISIKWTKKPFDATTQEIQNLNIPVYVPSYDSASGQLTFVLNTTGTWTDISNQHFNIKGETGATGSTIFNVQKYVGDINNLSNPTQNTFYVQQVPEGDIPDIYIYDGSEFINMEGLALDNYYLKTETYSSVEIDQMFNDVAAQQKIIDKLLDIDEIIHTND